MLLAAALWCEGAGKQYKLHIVTFHVEGEETDNPKMITPVKLGQEHRQYLFQQDPVLQRQGHRLVLSVHRVGRGHLRGGLPAQGARRHELKAITLTNQGKLLGLRCSDAPLQAVLIDRPIDDGVVVVWSGLQQKHLQEFRKRFPHVDDFQPPAGPQFAAPN